MYMYLCLKNFRNYQRKQNTLKSLKRKALDRNPDEFYFNMVNTQKMVIMLNIFFFTVNSSILATTVKPV